MCHRGKAIARAHGQQMSSDLIVRLRTGPGLLGTVEKYRRPARQGGRYKPFPPDFASLAVWPCGQHAVLDAPPRAHFIGNYPVFFSLFQIPRKNSALTEYERNPMFDLPSTRFQHLESEYWDLNQNDVILSGNRPLRAASGSVHRVLRLVPLLRDPNYSEPGRDRGAQAVRAGRYTICTAP